MKNLTKIQAKKVTINDYVDFYSINFDDYKEYDYYRLVDPINKKVYKSTNKELSLIENTTCYEVWNTGKPCKYCVSTEALLSKSEKKKFEYLDGDLYLAKVFPVIVNEKILVLELFQDLSESYLKTNNSFTKLSNLVEELNTLASLDTFTNLYSHSFMVNKMNALNIERENIQKEISLMCMDINKLKYVNDTFGHLCGDELILRVAEELRPLKDTWGIFPGRTGGDEFQVILIGYNKESAEQLLEETIHNLENIELKSNFHKASVSWAIETWEESQNNEEFIQLVDQKMYENKRSRY